MRSQNQAYASLSDNTSYRKLSKSPKPATSRGHMVTWSHRIGIRLAVAGFINPDLKSEDFVSFL